MAGLPLFAWVSDTSGINQTHPSTSIDAKSSGAGDQPIAGGNNGNWFTNGHSPPAGNC